MRAYATKFDLNNPLNPIWKVNYGKKSLANGFGCTRELRNSEIIMVGILDTLRIHNINDNDLISLVKLDSNGQVKFQRLYNYKTNSDAATNYLSTVSLELTSYNGCVVALTRINQPNPNPFIFVKYDVNGCDSSTAHCATLNLVGESESKIENEEVKIYPNPTDELINIECNVINEIGLIKILNVMGEVIFKETLFTQHSTFNIKHLKSGIYFLQIWDKENLLVTKKIIKD
jgi:hypothetical protein